jgi:hypothetical protein
VPLTVRLTVLLFGALLSASLRRSVAHRADLAFELAMAVAGGASALAALSAVYTQTDTLGGWDPSAAVVLLGTFQIVSGLRAALVEPNVQWFAQRIKDGRFDHVLTQPASSLFLATPDECAPAALAQQTVGAAQHVPADRVDDDVEPARDRARGSGRGADEAFRAEVPHQAGVVVAAGGGDVAAEDRRELDGEHADSAGAPRARHGHAPAGPSWCPSLTPCCRHVRLLPTRRDRSARGGRPSRQSGKAAGHDSAPESVRSRGRAVAGAQAASRRIAQHGSSRTVVHEGGD